jgi:DNA-binding NarL/FixJ family response regulator
VEKIRVVVANRPRLMRELVLAIISDQPDIEVVGEIQDDTALAHAVADAKPDFVIVALDRTDERPNVCDELLERNPNMKIIALAPERNRGVCVWAVTDIRSCSVESSELGILNVLRGKAQTTGQLPVHS